MGRAAFGAFTAAGAFAAFALPSCNRLTLDDKHPLEPPTQVRAVAGFGRVTLSWEPVEGAITYSVSLGIAPGSPDETLPDVRSPLVLERVGLHYYSVEAQRGVQAAASAEVSANALTASAIPLSPDWTEDSPPGTVGFGTSLAVGDVNGDGVGDLVVGAAGNGATAGQVSLYRGGPNGLPAGRVFGDDALGFGVAGGDRFGEALSVADVDGDGLAEIFAGAPDDDAGGFVRSGVVVAYKGRAPIPLTLTAEALFYGDANDRHFGASIATGDLDADGFNDVVASGEGNLGAGLVRGWFGGPPPGGLGLPSIADWSLDGPTGNTEFGCDVALGDVNGDGAMDVMVGEHQEPAATHQGRVLVHMAVPGSTPQPVPTIFSGLPNHHRGRRLASGDVDGDGYDDMVVGDAPDIGSTFNPTMNLFLGGPLGLVSTSSWSFIGTGPTANVPLEVAMGDVDGDGYADVLIGDVYANGFGGQVNLILGSPDLKAVPTVAWTVDGQIPDARLGKGLAMGDVNGDGLDDLLVGAPQEGASGEGRVRVFHGRRTSGPEVDAGGPVFGAAGATLFPSAPSFFDPMDSGLHQCTWDFGDGPPVTVPCSPLDLASGGAHTYSAPGRYVVRLRVESGGRFGEAITVAHIVERP